MRIRNGRFVLAQHAFDTFAGLDCGLARFSNEGQNCVIVGSWLSERFDDWFFISSTTQFAKQLIGETQGGNLKRQSANNNTQARLSTNELRSVLQDNRAQLVAQNMLENGHSKSNAEQEISTLLSVLDLLTNASMKLDTANQAMTLSAAVELSE